LSVEWVAEHFAPKVVVTVRNPVATVSSWRDLGVAVPHLAKDPRVRERFIEPYGLPEAPDASGDQVVQMAWAVGLQAFALKLACDRHPDWHVVRHEAMCADPKESFRKLYAALGLTWAPAADQYLDNVNRPGEGFETVRVAQDAPHRWRSRLSATEVLAIQRVLGEFPLAQEAV
jgi:hypothetical protein